MKDYSKHYYKEMPDENFFVDIFENKHNKKGITFDTHWHEHIQFFYFTSGEALVRCNSKRLDVCAGDLIIINSNELHYCENLCEDLSYYIIRVDLSFLFSNQIDSCQTKFMTPLAENLILFENLIRNDTEISGCINKIIKEYFGKELGFELAIKSYIYKLIVLLMRRYVKKILTKKEFDSQIKNLNQFNIILKYIEDNFTEHITIDLLAKMANMSIHHFCRLFKQITGKSAIEYINQMKIEKAVLLLQDSNYNITEIALACGFNDTNYFSRLFKKYKKISPTEIRKKKNKC